MASQTEWPQSLKEFANKAFAACTDANRKMVSEELRALIFKSFQEGTIQSTDWNKMVLQSLSTPSTKKNPLKKRATSSTSESLEEVVKREKRARRFERDQEEFRQQQQGDVATTATTATRTIATNHSTSNYNGNGSSSISLADRFSDWPPPQASSSGGKAYGKNSKNNKWAVTSSTSSAYVETDVADPNVIDWDEHTVVGTSTKLEKPYLRLTSAPDPKTVRPLPILQQALELLKQKWRTEGNYAYICDQFKSMRQDLTVQRIKNDFTVKVYEIHARIALERGDLGEYNQCQSQLRSLYAYHIPGCVIEFLAYRILYLLHTKNRRDVNALMTELTSGHKAEPAVAHALAVRSALVTGNYHAFFKLYTDAPNMNAYIMDHFIERERMNALLVMSKCFRPSVSLPFLTTELAFNDNEEAHQFLTEHHAAIYIEPTPAEMAAMMSETEVTSHHRQKKKKKQAKSFQIPLEKRFWDTKACMEPIYTAMEKYRKVDIKGQI